MGLVLLLCYVWTLLLSCCGVFSERVGSCLCLCGLVGNYSPNYSPNCDTGFVRNTRISCYAYASAVYWCQCGLSSRVTLVEEFAMHVWLISSCILASPVSLVLFFQAPLSRLLASRDLPFGIFFVRWSLWASSSFADISVFLPSVLFSPVIRGYVGPAAVLDLWSRGGFGCHR
jgi:hypothetical protein